MEKQNLAKSMLKKSKPKMKVCMGEKHNNHCDCKGNKRDNNKKEGKGLKRTMSNNKAK